MTERRSSDLINRIAKKIGPVQRATLQRRIQRRASAEGVSIRAAMYVVAKESGISIAGLLNQENQDVRSEVRAALGRHHGTTRNGTRSGVRSQKSARSPLGLRVRGEILTDPLLPEAVIRDAVRMSTEVYTILYIFENSVRNFINLVMTKDHGAAWWDTVMTSARKLSEVSAKVAGRMSDEQRLTWHGKRGAKPIYYSDFDDLIVILRSKKEVFRPYFAQFQHGAEWLADKMAEVTPSRNTSAHHNPLGAADSDRLRVNARDWNRHLEAIKDRI